MEAVVIRTDSDSAGRLSSLGLKGDLLREAAHHGLQYAFACTRHDPPVLPGIIAWGKAIRYLRDHLVPLGWTPRNPRNYAMVVHPDGHVAISVAAGDDGTGKEDVIPSTRSAKGPATREAVSSNQLSFAEIGESFPKPLPVAGLQTWLLLHFYDEEAGEIRCELSLPAYVDSDGYVSQWLERIILDPVHLNGASLSDAEEEQEPESVDVKVERRSDT